MTGHSIIGGSGRRFPQNDPLGPRSLHTKAIKLLCQSNCTLFMMSMETLKCPFFRVIHVLLVLLRSYYLPPVEAAARAAAVVAQ